MKALEMAGDLVLSHHHAAKKVAESLHSHLKCFTGPLARLAYLDPRRT